jgi:hypothetical protein
VLRLPLRRLLPSMTVVKQQQFDTVNALIEKAAGPTR